MQLGLWFLKLGTQGKMTGQQSKALLSKIQIYCQQHLVLYALMVPHGHTNGRVVHSILATPLHRPSNEKRIPREGKVRKKTLL